jgi:hypothetical protein
LPVIPRKAFEIAGVSTSK